MSLQVNLQLFTVKMKKSKHQREDLDCQRSANQIERHCGESVLFQERHQKPEANKDHHVDVLKNCKTFLINFVLKIYISSFTWINILDLFVTVNDTILASLGVDWVISIDLKKLECW